MSLTACVTGKNSNDRILNPDWYIEVNLQTVDAPNQTSSLGCVACDKNVTGR